MSDNEQAYICPTCQQPMSQVTLPVGAGELPIPDPLYTWACMAQGCTADPPSGRMEAVVWMKAGVLFVTIGRVTIQLEQEWLDLLRDAPTEAAAKLRIRDDIAPKLDKKSKRLLFEYAQEIVRAARKG